MKAWGKMAEGFRIALVSESLLGESETNSQFFSLNFFISSKNAGQKLSKNLRFRLRLRKRRWKLKSGSCLKRGEPNRVS